MKRLLSLLLFLMFTLAQAVESWETAGAWWITSNPGGQIQAGSIHLAFNSNFTVEADLYMDETPVGAGMGSWRYTDKKQTRVSWTFTDEDGWVYSGTLTKGVARGKFKNQGKLRGQVVASTACIVN